MWYRLKYYVDGARTITEEKIENLPMTQREVLGHAHVISAEPLTEEEANIAVKEMEKPIKKETKKNKK